MRAIVQRIVRNITNEATALPIRPLLIPHGLEMEIFYNSWNRSRGLLLIQGLPLLIHESAFTILCIVFILKTSKKNFFTIAKKSQQNFFGFSTSYFIMHCLNQESIDQLRIRISRVSFCWWTHRKTSKNCSQITVTFQIALLHYSLFMRYNAYGYSFRGGCFICLLFLLLY